MDYPFLAAGILIGFAAFGGLNASSQSTSKATSVAVNEAIAHAVLAEDSIRFELPLASPAAERERAVAWLLSPTGVVAGETAEDLPAGSRLAALKLPWPKDEQGNAAKEIGWYRIGYRIEVSNTPVVRDVLSVGAVASNLLALRMTRPGELAPGMPLSIRVFAGNPVTRAPYSGVILSATLTLDAPDSEKAQSKVAKQMIVRSAKTGSSGEAILNFPIKPVPGQDATLIVIGTLTGKRGITSSIPGLPSDHAEARISADLHTSVRSTVHIGIDKPLHKPGETVHLRALVFGAGGHALANAAMKLTIIDPDYETILEAPINTNRFGIASYDWTANPHIATGDYEAKITFGESDAIGGMQMITIQRYDLPEFAVSVAMDRGYYLDGQTAIARIHAGYLFGKQVAEGSLRVVRANQQKWNAKTGKYEEPEEVEQSAKLNANGDAEIRLDLKKDFDDFRERDNDQFNDIRFRAIVTDATTERSEPRSFTVRITHYPVHIYLRDVDANDRDGDYIVTTEYADGVPVSCKVTLDWMDQDSHPSRAAAVSTNRYGLARVHLRFPTWKLVKNRYGYSSGFGLRLTALDREGRISISHETEYAQDPNNIWITVAHTLLKPGQPIEAVMHGLAGSVVDVEAIAGNGTIVHQQVRMHSAEEPFTVPVSLAVHGAVTLHAYIMRGDLNGYSYRNFRSSANKSVLYPEDRELKLKLTGLQQSYLPGAEVSAGIAVREASGAPAPGALGITVIDTAVELRATTEEEENDDWFSGGWWNNGGSVSGITRQILNKTNMDRPVSEDLDLAAEAVMLNDDGADIHVEESDNDGGAEAQYQAGMEKNLKPLGAAVLAARPERLPATLEALRGIAQVAKLDDLLIDPWNTPYRISTKVESDDEVVQLISAGPDKQFGTGDDFTIELARRNYFELPGERLTNLLSEASAAGRELPGTSDSLKTFARAGGLDLDTTIDPQGKPYLFEIQLLQRYYSVHAFPHDAAAQPDGSYPCCAAWSSSHIDYFSGTEIRMDNAIRDWTNAGKPFPETEVEARQAFAAAGIDFDALRDPVGRPFHLRSAQVMAYSRIEKVQATAADLQEKTKFVTHLMRAIQIICTGGTDAENLDRNIVAQFVHPVAEQSGGDLKPQTVDAGTFKDNTGAIGGTVFDQTGAVIAGATVEVKTSGGVLVSSGESLANGGYLFDGLPPGLYTVKVMAKGFEVSFWRDIRVSPASLTTMDVTLSLGAETQTVSVVADALAVQTDSNVVSTLISSEEISKIAARYGDKSKISTPTFTPRLRHVFEETAYWAPSLETDTNGHASLHFRLPDSLTTWKLHALASTIDGRFASLDQTFKSFQPFFVDLDMPQVLTVGDEITLPVNLRNYTAHNLALPVMMKPADWFTLSTPAKENAVVPSIGTTPVLVGLHATKAVEAGPLNITAANASEGDAVEKTVRVHPDGEPRSSTASGLLRSGSTTLTLDLPADAIPGSIHADLLLYPNLGAHIQHSMKAILERPYGCGEQTISSTYPSLLYLELLKASKGTSPLQDETQDYLQQGYDRLLGYFSTSGGITYWGRVDEAPDAALTAYGIEFLIEAGPYIKVDQYQIEKAVLWLIDNQQADGSWKPHYGETSAEHNLYVADALRGALANDAFAKTVNKDFRERINKAVARAIGWAATSVAAVHDPYANALRLRMTENVESAGKLRAELSATSQHDRNGAHWSNQGSSPFYGWGHAGELETTALVLSALGKSTKSTDEQALANDALLYLLRSQDRYGIWYSGQATVRVLQALLPIAVDQMKSASNTQEFHLTVNGTPLNDKVADALRADATLIAAPRSLDLTTLLKPGHNELAFSNTSATALASAEVSASYYIPWTETAKAAQAKTQTGKDYGLDFGYSCAAENAKVGQPIDCTVNARRFGSSGYGMLLAEVGLPPGAEVDRASLAKLLDTWTISRYELQPDRIVFYLWSWRAEGERFSFRFTPRYAIHAKAAPATLFDYYNPDLKAVLAPQAFTVTDSLRK